MDVRLLKVIKEQIAKIENLKREELWGPKYNIWKDTTYRREL